MKIGYARVSSDEQSETPQVDELVAVGCERVYREKIQWQIEATSGVRTYVRFT